MARKFLIDTDTASDDAVALIMALRSPVIGVVAITTVSGNVPVGQATANALYTSQICQSDVPIFSGSSKPLVRPEAHADWFHGKDGLGDMNFPPAKKRAEAGHAVDAIIDIIKREPGIELVTLGPLSNIAQAISREPSMVHNISRCIVMGGNPCCVGNVTPAAEYNIWCDPEAASIVFRSGMNIEMVGWQLCRGDANLNSADIVRVCAIDTPLAHFAIDCNRVAMEANRKQSGEIGIALPDPVAMSIAIDPTIAIEASDHRVEIECKSELTRGQTIVDQLNVSGDDRNLGEWSNASAKRAKIIWKIDIAKWKSLLFNRLS